jgi:hypothetical protein
VLSIGLVGCGVGPARLPSDQLEYARAISEAQNRQTLLNIVRLRYGGAPSFLTVNQVISSYTLEQSIELGLNAFPGSRNNNVGTALGTLSYTDRPTMTFTPLTGEDLARTSVRPPSPANLLPLAQSGLPIDVLFRLGVQSVGTLQNTVVLAGYERGSTPDFLELLAGMRTLQEHGLITVRLVPAKEGNRVFLGIAEGAEPTLRATTARTRRLLGMAPTATEAEVVFGRVATRPNQVPMLTRSIVGILSQVSTEIEAPPEDVAAGRTIPSLSPQFGVKPTITIRAGTAEPTNAYTSVRYENAWFWIDDRDFNSKVAYTILQLLIALVEGSTTGRGPILTIPAG